MLNSWLVELALSTWQTIYMVLLSGLVATLVGLPLGVLLLITRSHSIVPNATVNKSLSLLVNIGRSIPFVILMIAIIPFTRLIAGTSIGTTAAIVPLSIAAIPFVARLVESALQEVAGGMIETGLALGASSLQIILKILIPEALPGIVNGITITLINLVSYSAMAGAVGGGGLGDLAIRYGYQRFDVTVMVVTIIILIVFVQLLQLCGDYVVKRISHR